jgi:hypothetical protein
MCFNWAPRHGGLLASGGIAPRIDLGTGWRWVVSSTPRPLYRRVADPQYPLDRRLGGSQSRSGRGGEETNSQPLPGLEPPMIQPVAQRCSIELPWLLFNIYEFYIPVSCVSLIFVLHFFDAVSGYVSPYTVVSPFFLNVLISSAARVLVTLTFLRMSVFIFILSMCVHHLHNSFRWVRIWY